MVPHRGLADKQSLCDRSILQPLADQRNNLVFPARQRRNLLDFGVLTDLATVNFPYRLDQHFGRLALQHESGGSQFGQHIVIGRVRPI